MDPGKTDSEKVRYFTYCAGQVTPNKPEVMNKEEVHFLVKMMLDEIMELYATVADAKEAKYNMIKMITDSKDINQSTECIVDNTTCIAEQVDALVDCYYYSLNAMAKKGVNMSSVFDIVHESNMSKRDLESGIFLKRSDGKIIKPVSFRPPDIVAEIKRQSSEGSFIKE